VRRGASQCVGVTHVAVRYGAAPLIAVQWQCIMATHPLRRPHRCR